MEEYIIAHDLGTSGNKATLYDLRGKLKGSVVCEYPTFFLKEHYAEQNPEDWWTAICKSTNLLLEKTGISKKNIIVLSFSAQMMGCLLVDRDGVPLRPMVIWADTRSEKQEKQMIQRVGEKKGYEITGHRLSASYSAAKLLWIKENEPELYKRAHKMLHAKDYIIFRLTGNMITDYSDASGTNLLDIRKKEWSDELLKAFQIQKSLLPDIYPSTHIAGKTHRKAAEQMGLLEGTPVVIGGGDGSCACVGAGVVKEGKTYNVIGSSSWISKVSKEPFFDQGMRTFNWIHLDSKYYTPCGTMQAAGLSYRWYRDMFGQEEYRMAKESGSNVYQILNQTVEKAPAGANGLLYLPYLMGERSPRWNIQAKGSFIGLSMSTEKSDMIRAVLEGVGYNLKLILEILEQQEKSDSIIVIGGGAKDKTWLQILADIWQRTLEIPRYLEEATSMGAAVCGGVGVGVFKNFEVMEQFNNIEEIITPNSKNAEIYGKMYQAFNSAYEGLCHTFDLL